MSDPQYCAHNTSTGLVIEHGVGRVGAQDALDNWTSPPNFELRIFDPRQRLTIPGIWQGEGIDAVFIPAAGVVVVYSRNDIAEAGGEIQGGLVVRREPAPIAEAIVREAIQTMPPGKARQVGVRVMKRLARRYIAKVRAALALDDQDGDFADPEDVARIAALKDVLRPIIVAASQATTVQEFRDQFDALVAITGHNL